MIIPRCLAKLVELTPKRDSRRILQGIHLFRREGLAYAAVTDGKKLLQVSWKEESWQDLSQLPGLDLNPVEDFKTTLPAELWRELFSKVPRSKLMPRLDNLLLDEHPQADGRLNLATFDLETLRSWQVMPRDGNYPNYAHVFPNRETGKRPRVCLDAGHSAALLTVLQTLIKENQGCQRVWMELGEDPRSPVLFIKQEDESILRQVQTGRISLQLTAVLMPIRDNT